MRVKKRTLYITAASILLLAVIITLTIIFSPHQDTYGVDAQGILHAPQNTNLNGQRTLNTTNENETIYRTTFQSYGATIVGNLYIPNNNNGQGMLILPGGGVSKEGEAPTANAFAQRGYIVLTIDQRGVGETGGPFNSIDDDYTAFEAGQIPTEHLLILDALAGIQYPKQQPEVKGKILLSGESMGGRAAIVAARLSTNINGLLIISSSGFGNPTLPAEQQRFLNSFNPDTNIQQITVPIIFIHSTNDTTIPLTDANNTYQEATAPKQFYTIDHCPHGYCNAMEPDITQALKLATTTNITRSYT